MPRSIRIEYAGAFYHVMARGNRREEIFRGERSAPRVLQPRENPRAHSVARPQWKQELQTVCGRCLIWLMPPKEITELKDAIRATHGCESLHVESVPVKEVFEGQTAWEGTVEIFDLVGHPKAKRAYAWSYREGNETKSLAILEIPPVDSPESAVKVAIAAEAKKAETPAQTYAGL